jgi:hypothetical protein
MRKKPNPARRHHVVSKFYLRGFADSRQQIMRRQLDSDTAALRPISNAAVRNDFNTLNVEGLAPDHFEKELGTLEGAAGMAFRVCLGDQQWPLPPDHRLALAEWIAVQYLRGEDKRAMAADLYRTWQETEVAPASTGELRDMLGVPPWVPDSEVETIRARVLAPDAQFDRHVHLSSISTIMERAVPAVLLRPWTQFTFTWDALGTADVPVVRIPGPDATGPVGLGDAAELYVPLTSRAGLYLGKAGVAAVDRREDGTASLAAMLNLLVFHGAHRTLYYRPGTNPFAGGAMPGPGRSPTGAPPFAETDKSGLE